jgi:hypothetical protein|tara:strand:+ start:65 stop:409 length:345 start_codon:yes stop_codon:yes gene_type:complete
LGSPFSVGPKWICRSAEKIFAPQADSRKFPTKQLAQDAGRIGWGTWTYQLKDTYNDFNGLSRSASKKVDQSGSPFWGAFGDANVAMIEVMRSSLNRVDFSQILGGVELEGSSER